MKIKTGTDIIEVNRIKKAIEKSNGRFLNKVFTKIEIEYCNSKKTHKYEHFAARFAAKEACFKAISELLENNYSIGWKDIEIINISNGKPNLVIHKNIDKIQNIDISLAHSKEYAIANVAVLVL